MADHGGALDYDLMTLTQYTIDDVGERLRMRSLANFVRHLPVTSATKIAVSGGLTREQAEWVRGDVTAQLLSVLIDELRGMEWMYQSTHSKARVRRPRRFPTPWTSDAELGVRRYGRDPIPVSEFDAWFNRKEA